MIYILEDLIRWGPLNLAFVQDGSNPDGSYFGGYAVTHLREMTDVTADAAAVRMASLQPALCTPIQPSNITSYNDPFIEAS